ncbi:MAG TPA: HAD-IA family hydrolase [Steroidobacteraceae bacterium]|nr:HAD-IA family hydrolase [Steroidobacteraceae bacterium]
MPQIESVVFDVGWVLVHLDYAPLLNYIAAAGQRYNLKEVIAAIDLEAHERGELDSTQLLDNMSRLAPQLDPDVLKQHWTGMFTPVDAMFSLARTLSHTHRVYLLSNVGELHWTYLDRQYQLLSLAHAALPSFEARVMKPHRDIYKLAEQRFDLNPATTVFIDDLSANVESARQCGWHVIQHSSPEKTISTLATLGVTA